MSGFTIPYFCPLCLTSPVVDPVLLHTPPSSHRVDRGSGSDSSFSREPRGRASPEPSACVACKACAASWLPILSREGTTGGFACPQCSVGSVNATEELPLLAEVPSPPRRLANVVVRPHEDDGVNGEAPEVARAPFDLADAIAGWREAAAAAAAAVEDHEREDSSNNTERCGVHESPAEASSATCGICEEEGSGSRVCVQCGFALCEDCHAATHTKGRFKLHRVLSLAEAKEAVALDGPPPHSPPTKGASQSERHARKQRHRQCDLHSYQSLDLYCRSCGECICVTCCFSGSHKGDDVVPLTDIAHESRHAVRRMSERMAGTAEEAATTRQRLQALEPEYASLAAEVEAQMRSAFAALHEALSGREASLVAQLRAATAGVKTGMATQASLLKAVSAALNGSEAKLSAFLEETDNVTLMELLPSIRDGHSRLQSLGSRLSDDATRAEANLSARLSSKDGALAAFSLFPLGGENTETMEEEEEEEEEEKKKEEEEDEPPSPDNGVARYARRLATLGQLTIESRYPIPHAATPHRTEEGEDGHDGTAGEAETETAERREAMPSDAVAGEGRSVHRRAAVKRMEQGGKKDEASLVQGSNEAILADPARKAAPAVSRSALVDIERKPLSLPPMPEEGDVRRTEAHFVAKTASTILPLQGEREVEWPMFGSTLHRTAAAATAVAAHTAQTDGCLLSRKRLLDFSFDRTFGETLIANASAPSSTEQPVAKASRLDSAAGALTGPPQNTTAFLSFEGKPEEKRVTSGTGLRLELRI